LSALESDGWERDDDEVRIAAAILARTPGSPSVIASRLREIENRIIALGYEESFETGIASVLLFNAPDREMAVQKFGDAMKLFSATYEEESDLSQCYTLAARMALMDADTQIVYGAVGIVSQMLDSEELDNDSDQIALALVEDVLIGPLSESDALRPDWLLLQDIVELSESCS
jgi:hypothetical protein